MSPPKWLVIGMSMEKLAVQILIVEDEKRHSWSFGNALVLWCFIFMPELLHKQAHARKGEAFHFCTMERGAEGAGRCPNFMLIRILRMLMARLYQAASTRVHMCEICLIVGASLWGFVCLLVHSQHVLHLSDPHEPSAWGQKGYFFMLHMCCSTDRKLYSMGASNLSR